MRRRTWGLAGWTVLSVLCAGGLAVGGDLPRYRLEVGEEILYRETSDFRYQGGSFGEAVDWSFRVVRKNPDGGWRVVGRVSRASDRSGKSAGAPDVSLAWFDVKPDGSTTPNASWATRFDPSTIFPRLPDDARAAESGWDVAREGHGQLTMDFGCYRLDRETIQSIIIDILFNSFINTEIQLVTSGISDISITTSSNPYLRRSILIDLLESCG